MSEYLLGFVFLTCLFLYYAFFLVIQKKEGPVALLWPPVMNLLMISSLFNNIPDHFPLKFCHEL